MEMTCIDLHISLQSAKKPRQQPILSVPPTAIVISTYLFKLFYVNRFFLQQPRCSQNQMRRAVGIDPPV